MKTFALIMSIVCWIYPATILIIETVKLLYERWNDKIVARSVCFIYVGDCRAYNADKTQKSELTSIRLIVN